jgi:hypothetical protein
MAKRTIIVEIDSGEKLCGGCQFSHSHYVGQPERRHCGLFGVGKKFGERCDECMKGEFKSFPANVIINRCGPSDCHRDYKGNIPIVNEEGRVTSGTAVCTKCGCTAYAESAWQ